MKKSLLIFISLLLLTPSSYAGLKLDDLNEPMPSFYRMGTTDSPETKFDFDLQPEVKPVVQKEPDVESPNITYADLSIKKMAMEVSKSIQAEYDEMQSDLSLLWQGAATNSDTIKFAIYKLSNPEKDKPDTSTVKKVLTTIAGMSTFIGAGMGNPVLASASLIGGNTLGIFSQDTKALR